MLIDYSYLLCITYKTDYNFLCKMYYSFFNYFIFLTKKSLIYSYIQKIVHFTIIKCTKNRTFYNYQVYKKSYSNSIMQYVQKLSTKLSTFCIVQYTQKISKMLKKIVHIVVHNLFTLCSHFIHTLFIYERSVNRTAGEDPSYYSYRNTGRAGAGLWTNC